MWKTFRVGVIFAFDSTARGFALALSVLYGSPPCGVIRICPAISNVTVRELSPVLQPHRLGNICHAVFRQSPLCQPPPAALETKPQDKMDNFASSFRSYAMIGLVTLLSLVFILQFGGPQAEGCTSRSGGAAYAARVDGESISVGEFQSVYNLLGFSRAPAEQRMRDRIWEDVLNGMIERSLLAHEARELGYHVSSAEIMEWFATEKAMRVSMAHDSRQAGGQLDLSQRVANSDGIFDLERARDFIQRDLRRSVGEFQQAQIDEALAERMRRTIVASVEVSESEVWDSYVRENDRARIKFLRFRPAFYEDRVDMSDEAIVAWMGENSEAVDAAYEENQHLYTDLEEQVRARHILIRASRDASEDVRTDARRRAEGLLARAQAGEDFATLAREASEDTSNAPRGGDLGFFPRGQMVSEFETAAFDMDVNEISELVETSFGFHIIKVVAKREGDVPVDEAKREISERLYKEATAADLARQDAARILGMLQSGSSLEEVDALFEPEAPAPAEPVDGEEPEPVEAPERDPRAPRLDESRSFGRIDNPIPGPFDATPLLRDIFSRTLEDALPEEPFEIGSDFVVYQLTERTEATRDEFTDEVRNRLRESLLNAKRNETLTSYVGELRERATREGRIAIREFDIETEVSGNGSISSEPGGIDCGTDCAARFAFGEMVTLTAEPGEGSRFVNWTGACTGSSRTCVVTLNQAQAVGATFRGSRRPSAPSMEAAPAEEGSEEESGEEAAE